MAGNEPIPDVSSPPLRVKKATKERVNWPRMEAYFMAQAGHVPEVPLASWMIEANQRAQRILKSEYGYSKTEVELANDVVNLVQRIQDMWKAAQDIVVGMEISTMDEELEDLGSLTTDTQTPLRSRGFVSGEDGGVGEGTPSIRERVQDEIPYHLFQRDKDDNDCRCLRCGETEDDGPKHIENLNRKLCFRGTEYHGEHVWIEDDRPYGAYLCPGNYSQFV